ncbi:uncharacterized protein DKFZp434B061 [Centroberyx affinis]|uniref:uncharacterized protein DKFZp434B061 n=1 Tax=Centroberyx affinis TaxID=166261 RepID=UPI003A5C6E1C
MKGTSKHKVVSSGRLTGGVKAQPARRRVTPKPAPWTEPAYSLYSTDSEDQVTTIHKGLDRCAALLSDILQAERAEAKPSVARAVKGGAAKPRTSSSMGKKTTKKPVTKTGSVPVQKSFPATRHAGLSGHPPSRANPHSKPSNPGTDVHFNGRLTTSTPTLSPEKPVSSTTGQPANSQTLIHSQHLSPTIPPSQPLAFIPPSQPQASIPLSQPQASLPSSQLRASIPLSQPQASLPPSQPQASIPLSQPQASLPSSQFQASIPLSQPQASLPPSQLQDSIPLSQLQASLPSFQLQASIPLSQLQASIPPSQSQSSLPSSQLQASIPSSQPQASIPSSQLQASIPPSQLQASIPSSQLQASIPLSQPQTSLPSSQLQASILSSQLQASIPSYQLQASIPSSQPQASIPLSQPQASIPSSQLQASIPFYQLQPSIPSSQPQASIPLSQPQASIPPSQLQASISSSQPQASIPLSQLQVSIPSSQLQASIPLSQPQASLPSSQLQASIPPSQSQSSLPSSQLQASIPLSQLQVSIPSSQPQASIPLSQPHASIPVSLSQSQPFLQPQTPPYSLPPPLSQLLSPSACLPLPQSHCQPPLTQTDCRSGSKAPQTDCRAQGCQWSHDSEPSSGEGCGHRGEEEECVPVRDRNSQSRSEGCTAEMEVKVKTVQYLLGELKALITGQGGVAERLLSDLEQTVSLLPLIAGSSNIQAEIALVLQPLRSQNSQLRRRVRILNQQLQERERAERETMERHSDSEVLTLQAELSAAQSRLQELQDDVGELRQALQDTQSQLRDREAENALMKTDLEDTSSRLLESERERSEVALLAQQRLEEIQHLNRMLQSHVSSDSPTVIDSSGPGPPLTKQLLERYLPGRDTSEPAPDPVSQYLISLGQNGRVLTCQSDTQPEPTASVDEVVGRSVCAKKKLTFAPLRETMMSSHPITGSQQGGGPPVTSVAHCQSLDTVLRLLRQSKSLISPHLDQSLSSGLARSSGEQPEKGRDLDRSLSRCEAASVSSEWSVGSGSTFDTRDEVAFRDGLAALDASIASLQRTIMMDLRR